MKNWTLKQRILASFLVVLAIMGAMAAMAFSRLHAIADEAAALRSDSMPGLYYSTTARAAWTEGFQLVQEYLEVEDAHVRERYRAWFAANSQQLTDALTRYRLSAYTDQERRWLEDLQRERERFEKVRSTLLEVGDSGDLRSARTRARLELKPLWGTGRETLQAMVQFNRERAQTSADQIGKSVDVAVGSTTVSLLLAVLAAAACGFLLMRAITYPMRDLVATLSVLGGGDLTRRLALKRNDEFAQVEQGLNAMAQELTTLVGQAQRTAIQVATSVTEIAATSKQQQATATEVAATTTEIGATSREISATSRDLVRTMSEVSVAAEQTSLLAGGGQAGLARMELTMNSVMEAAGSVNAKLAVLNEKAGNITQVVTTINKVADQTNLLSLNAAIEAEKAGEYGRGFAVVATEIRRLADQTAVATYDIEQMVREIQSSVAAGVMGMDKFSEEVRRGIGDVQQVGDQLAQIIGQVQSLVPRVMTVNEGMLTQATGAEQIDQALSQLSDATQQTVESLRQSSLAIDELITVASGLRTGVSRFKV
ncbi:MAG: methyl-accepting chemotaxis protein [Burkholderiaceae bacterium]|nr:methyl-accepting chemotaxis protein [Burkholderiaceae bacterium]